MSKKLVVLIVLIIAVALGVAVIGLCTKNTDGKVSSQNSGSEQTVRAQTILPQEIILYIDEIYSLVENLSLVSDDATISYSNYSSRIINISNDIINPKNSGTTILKLTIVDNGKLISEKTTITVYETVKIINFCVTDGTNVMQSLYVNNIAPITYYLIINYSSVLTSDIVVEKSTNVTNFSLISKTSGSYKYSFQISNTSNVSFCAKFKKQSKTINYECSEITDNNEMEYNYVFSIPTAFRQAYTLVNNVLTVTSTQESLYILIQFSIENSHGDIYLLSYASEISSSNTLTSCQIELENNSIFLITSGKGNVDISLICKVDDSISCNLTIIIN